MNVAQYCHFKGHGYGETAIVRQLTLSMTHSKNRGPFLKQANRRQRPVNIGDDNQTVSVGTTDEGSCRCGSRALAAGLETVAFLITIGIVMLQVIEAIRDVRIRILCL